MHRIFDYLVSLKRYKTRQLFYRIKYILEPERLISKSYRFPDSPFNSNGSIYLNPIEPSLIKKGKKAQIIKTLLNLDLGFIDMFHKKYPIINFFDHSDIYYKPSHKLMAYELSYLQFCHDLFFGVNNNLVDNNKLNDYSEKVSLLLSQSKELTNKHPFWYPYSVSTRIINLSLFLYAIAHKSEVEAKNKSYIYNHLILELNYLSDHLEFDSDGNHLLKNFFALLIGYTIIGNREKASNYLSFIEESLEEQILECGLHYEKSLDYHMLVLHDLFFVFLFANSNGIDTELIKQQLIKMLVFSEILLKQKHKPLFHDSFKPTYFPHKELILLIKSFCLNQNIAMKKINDLGPYSIYTIKDIYLIVDKSQISPEYCMAHSHDACLHYELWYKGIKFISDSGNGTYTESPERNFFRSSQSHNMSVSKENIGQSILLKSFRFGRTAKLLYFDEKISDKSVKAKGALKGYFNGFKTNTLIRTFQIIDNHLIIEDTIDSDIAVSYIHFHPETDIEEMQDLGCYLLNRDGIHLRIEVNGNNSKPEIIDTIYSDEFYKIKNKKTLRIKYQKNIKYQISPIA